MKRVLAAAVLIALAACSPSGEAEGENAVDFARRAGVQPAANGVPTVAEINAQPVVAPTGAAQLTPLSADAPKALGAIEGGCSFVYQSRSLLVVGSPDGASGGKKGVLVVDGRQIVLPAASSAGDQAPTLSGEGYTVAVRLTGGAQAADLTVTGPGGATTFSPGTWNCTP